MDNQERFSALRKLKSLRTQEEHARYIQEQERRNHIKSIIRPACEVFTKSVEMDFRDNYDSWLFVDMVNEYRRIHVDFLVSELSIYCSYAFCVCHENSKTIIPFNEPDIETKLVDALERVFRCLYEAI